MQDLFDRYAGKQLWERASARAERRPQVGRSGLLQRLGFDDPWAATADAEEQADPLLFVSGRAYRRWMQRRLQQRFWRNRERGIGLRSARGTLGALTLGRVRFPGEGRGPRAFLGWGPSLGTDDFVLPERALEPGAEAEQAELQRSRAWFDSSSVDAHERRVERIVEVVREVPVATQIAQPAASAAEPAADEAPERRRAATDPTAGAGAVSTDAAPQQPAPPMAAAAPALPGFAPAAARPLPPIGRVARLEAQAPVAGELATAGPAARSPLFARVLGAGPVAAAGRREDPAELGARVASRLLRSDRRAAPTQRVAERALEAETPLWTGVAEGRLAPRRGSPGVRRLALASPSLDAVLKGLPDDTPTIGDEQPRADERVQPVPSTARVVRSERPAARASEGAPASDRRTPTAQPRTTPTPTRRASPMSRALVAAGAPSADDALAPALLDALRTGKGRTRVAGRSLRLRWAGASEVVVRSAEAADPSVRPPARPPVVSTATVYRTPDGRFVGAPVGRTAKGSWSGARALTTALAPWSGARSGTTAPGTWSGAVTRHTASTPWAPATSVHTADTGWTGAASTTTAPGAWRGMEAVRTAISAYRRAASTTTAGSAWRGASVQRTLAGDWTGAALAHTATGPWSGASVARTAAGDWAGAGVTRTASGEWVPASSVTTRSRGLPGVTGTPLAREAGAPAGPAPSGWAAPREGADPRDARVGRGAWSGAPVSRGSALPWRGGPVGYARYGGVVPTAGARTVRMVRGASPDPVSLQAPTPAPGPASPSSDPFGAPVVGVPSTARTVRTGALRPLDAAGARFLGSRAWTGAQHVRTGAMGPTDQDLYELATRPWSGAARVRAALGGRGAGALRTSEAGRFLGATSWLGAAASREPGARRTALRAPLETTLAATNLGELPADAPGWAARAAGATGPRLAGDFVQALARARDPEEVLRIIVREQAAPQELGLSAPTARVVQTLRREHDGATRASTTTAAAASPATLQAPRRRKKPGTVRIISGWGSASVGARGTSVSGSGGDAAGEDRMSRLVKRLRGLVLLAEQERNLSEARAQVRLHAEGAPDPAEGGAGPDEEGGGAQKDIDALGHAILPRVVEELELRRQRRPEDASEY